MSFWGCVQGPGICSILDFYSLLGTCLAHKTCVPAYRITISGEQGCCPSISGVGSRAPESRGCQAFGATCGLLFDYRREDEWDIFLEVAKYRQRDLASDAQWCLMIRHRLHSKLMKWQRNLIACPLRQVIHIHLILIGSLSHDLLFQKAVVNLTLRI